MDSISSNSNTENYPENMDSSKTKTVDSQPTRATRKAFVDPDSKSLDPSSLDLYRNSRPRESRTATNIPTTAQADNFPKKNGSFFSKLKLFFENKCGCCLCFD
jgi:hypothetical protein